MNLKINCRQKVGNYSRDAVVKIFPYTEFVPKKKKKISVFYYLYNTKSSHNSTVHVRA